MLFIYTIVGEGPVMKLGLAIIFYIRIISVYFDINLSILKRTCMVDSYHWTE